MNLSKEAGKKLLTNSTSTYDREKLTDKQHAESCWGWREGLREKKKKLIERDKQCGDYLEKGEMWRSIYIGEINDDGKGLNWGGEHTIQYT